MRIVVFAGPTIPAAAVRERLDCTVLPPAGQGDLWRAVRRHRPDAIGLIDGLFLNARAVWHREILAALTEGVHVLGAASMGALRAAELDAFGMRGVGRVYAAYRDGIWPGFDAPFEDDDEVAVQHAPAAVGSAPLSDAMVDLRATLLAAEAAGAIDRAERDRLVAHLKCLPFPARSFAALEAAGGAGLRGHRVHQKREDALALLAELAAGFPAPFAPGFRMERPSAWQRLAAEAERDLAPGEDPVAERVLDALRLDPVAWTECALAAEGRAATRPPDPADLAATLDAFRIARHLPRRADLDRWMHANGLDAAGLARLLAEQPDRTVADPPTRLMADHLRATGRFAPIRAEAEARIVSTSDPPPSRLDCAAAVEWYFVAHLGVPPPADPRAFWQPLGWRDAGHFEDAVWTLYRSRPAASAAG